jgi:hypothetical protein
MSFTELLEAAKALPREEQLQLIEAIQDPKPLIPVGAILDFWSPITAPDTSTALLRNLKEDKKRRGEIASA